MAGRIQGITVEIGGDTTKLQTGGFTLGEAEKRDWMDRVGVYSAIIT